MSAVTRLHRCPLHGASRTSACEECATKPLHDLAREILDHDSTAFMVAPIRRIVEAVASAPIDRIDYGETPRVSPDLGHARHGASA